MSRVVLLLMILSPWLCMSQNLVRNCNFEQFTDCPTSHGQFDVVLHWYTPGEGTTDFCHDCSGSATGIPDNQWGSQEPYAGQGYGHIISYYPFQGNNYREYMAADLGCTLRPGERYTVNFWVSCSDRSKYAIDRIGLHFSDNKLWQNGEGLISIGGDPHIQHPGGSVIQNKTEWRRVTGVYTATGNERYITIGNFFSDDETTVHEFAGLSTRYGSFYVDHVEIRPENPWLELGEDTVLCPQETFILDAAVPCGISYSWNDGATGPVREITQEGYYSVTVEIGCGSISDGLNVLFMDEPDLGLPADTLICSGDSYLLSVEGNFDSFLWDSGETGPQRNIAGPGTYWVEVVTENNCLFRDTVTVSGLTAPFVELGADTVICMGDSLLLVVPSSGPQMTCLWSDNSTGNTLMAGSTGRYWVNVSNPCGSASDTIFINTRNCNAVIWMPNAFTPDGDGTNDRFRASGSNIDEFYMAVYNRWGEKIYESGSIEEGWNGSDRNGPCDEGVYIWLIRYRSLGNELPVEETLKGTLMLFRN